MILDTTNKKEILNFFGYDEKDVLLVHYTNIKTKKCIRSIGIIGGCINIIFSYTLDTYKGALVSYISCSNNKKGPSEVYFHCATNVVYRITYLSNYLKHRFGGPSDIIYDYNRVVEEKYYIRGRLHNSIGPAYRLFINGCWYNRYYLNGKRVEFNNFFKRFEY
jgi:hypothetical protein